MRSNRVRISGWRVGAKKVSATEELRSSTSLGFAGAKKVIDDVLEGTTVEVVPLKEIEAEVLADRLTQLGFVSVAHFATDENA